MAWLSGYSYKKKIGLTGATGAGTNYQVPLTVHSGSGSDAPGVVYLNNHCTNFPNDIRFTDDDGETELDHWCEDLTADPCKFWIEVKDDLGSNQDIYVYYGKSGAGSDSNGNNTWIEFAQWTANAEGWTEDTPVAYTADGVRCGTSTGALYASLSEAKFRFRVKAKNNGGSSTYSWFRPDDGTHSTESFRLDARNGYNDLIIRVDGVSKYTEDPFGITTFKVYEILHDSQVEFLVDGTSKYKGTKSTYTLNRLAVANGGGSDGYTYYTDFCLGKYVDPEPTVGTPGSEEEPPVVGRSYGYIIG